jgi:signal transduction histidine kinase
MIGLKTLARPRTPTETFVASLVFWNPVIAGVVKLLFSGIHDFARSWAVATTIAEITAIQCFVAVHLVRKLEHAYYTKRKRTTPVRGVGFYFVVAALIMPLALPLGFAGGGHVARLLGADWVTPDLRAYRVGIGFGLVLAAAFFFQRSRRESMDASLEAEARSRELENRRLRAQLSALTAEMNPHLLFNALNTVAALLHQDPDRAEDVIVQLADLYRGVLLAAGSSTHPLEDELRICTSYLQIEHARFGDRLLHEVDVDHAIDVRAMRVPVLILQPIVENAVKHGVSKRVQGGMIRVLIRLAGPDVILLVDDDGVGVGHSTDAGAGKGLANCRERLLLTYGERASLDVGPRAGRGTRVVVRLPSAGEPEAV